MVLKFVLDYENIIYFKISFLVMKKMRDVRVVDLKWF